MLGITSFTEWLFWEEMPQHIRTDALKTKVKKMKGKLVPAQLVSFPSRLPRRLLQALPTDLDVHPL